MKGNLRSVPGHTPAHREGADRAPMEKRGRQAAQGVQGVRGSLSAGSPGLSRVRDCHRMAETSGSGSDAKRKRVKPVPASRRARRNNRSDDYFRISFVASGMRFSSEMPEEYDGALCPRRRVVFS